MKLPELTGHPIYVRFQPELTAHRGKLLCDRPHRGAAVYAAAFLRSREIVLEAELANQPRLLQMILIHELLHFVWLRLGNTARNRYSELLTEEHIYSARGELGESSAVKKSELNDRDCLTGSKAWREYVCESFCDSGAWLYSGQKRKSPFTLGARWKKRREIWFEAHVGKCSKC